MGGIFDYNWWAIWNTTNKSILQDQAIQNVLLHWSIMLAHRVVIHFVTYVLQFKNTNLFIIHTVVILASCTQGIKYWPSTYFLQPRFCKFLNQCFLQTCTTYVEIKCQLDATEVFIADLIACSTCFGHHYAHHQELKRIIQWLLPVVFRAVVFKLLVWCGAEGYVSGLQDAAASCKPDT